MREVAMAYDELASGIARYRAAVEQAKAARLAYTSDADTFRHWPASATGPTRRWRRPLRRCWPQRRRWPSPPDS